MGPPKRKAARTEGGLLFPQQLHSSGAEKLCLLPWEPPWAVDGRPVAGSPGQAQALPVQAVLGRWGLGEVEDPLRALFPRSSTHLPIASSTKACGLVAVTSWPAADSSGVVLFLNIGSGC